MTQKKKMITQNAFIKKKKMHEKKSLYKVFVSLLFCLSITSQIVPVLF